MRKHSNLRARPVLAGFAAAALIAAAAAPAGAGPRAGDAVPDRVGTVSAKVDPCADVLLVGARGAGQKAAGRNEGFGAQVANVRNRLEDALAGDRTVEAAAIDYRAPAVGVIFTSRTGLNTYLKGISSGVTKVVALLTEQAGACPDQHLVLAGFSQGAMVMHQALRRLAKAGHTAILDRIGGAVLLGDGDREKNTKATLHGTAPRKGWGIRRPLGNQPIPQQLAARTHTVCAKHDIVCDTSSAIAKKLKKQQVGKRALVKALLSLDVRKYARGKRKHTGPTYNGDAPIVAEAVDQTAATLLGWPDPGGLTPPPPTRIRGGWAHMCQLGDDGQAWCWGYNQFGRLGTVTDESSETTPVAVSGDHTFTSIAAGHDHSCGLDVDGDAWCWGHNNVGQLGNDTVIDSTEPVKVIGDHTFIAITAGWDHTCGLDTDGVVWCWGSNFYGQLGDGTNTDRGVPVPVAEHSFAYLNAFADETCAIDTAGDAWCWGDNLRGQLGDGTKDDSTLPVPVSGGHVFTQIEGSQYHACGIDVDGAAWCWGSNLLDALGTEAHVESTVPAPVDGDHVFTDLASGQSHTCGLDDEGSAWCWGRNEDGQVGDGTNDPRPVPTAVSGGHTFTSIGAGLWTTCALDTAGDTWCWGLNQFGETGYGEATAFEPTPVKALFPDSGD